VQIRLYRRTRLVRIRKNATNLSLRNAIIGTDPAGLAVTLLVTSTASIKCAADLLETGDPAMGWSTSALPDGPAVERLSSFLAQLSLSPETMDNVGATELAANVLTADAAQRREPAGTRLNSRKIVRDAIDFAESTKTFQPTMSQLCRAACASESRVRQAFVEVLDAPRPNTSGIDSSANSAPIC
jgi:hypothetical protein